MNSRYTRRRRRSSLADRCSSFRATRIGRCRSRWGRRPCQRCRRGRSPRRHRSLLRYYRRRSVAQRDHTQQAAQPATTPQLRTERATRISCEFTAPTREPEQAPGQRTQHPTTPNHPRIVTEELTAVPVLLVAWHSGWRLDRVGSHRPTCRVALETQRVMLNKCELAARARPYRSGSGRPSSDRSWCSRAE